MAIIEEERNNTLDILTALEFGAKKEEKEVLDKIFDSLRVKRKHNKELTAQAILQGPGFESFLLEMLKEVQPFALMLKDIYTFLNQAEAITRRRASIFRVSSANATAKLEFSLDNFPRELIATLTQTEIRRAVVELRFPGMHAQDSEGLIDWHQIEAHDAWNAISPRWDNDFYDDGFHRALSYAHSILPQGDEAAWSRLREIAEPLLDRLAAIVACANSIQTLEINDANFSGWAEPSHFRPTRSDSHFHRVLCEAAHPTLQLATRTQYMNEKHRSVLDELRWHLYSMVIAIHLFRNERLRREDRDGWLQKRLDLPAPEAYIDLITDLASSYRQKLDHVAPIVEESRETVLEERLLEFLLLPFWKNRWFLYELWTLVLVLGSVSRCWALELEGLEEVEPAIVEWRLPGGTATAPVAIIGTGKQQVFCWTQRKTYHPGTGEGMEPDLRLTTALPSFHDLLIVENKDRRKPSGREMAEIARRYVEGTCTESFWLVNYDTFTPDLERLEFDWPDQKVHVVSGFRPGQVPAGFEHELTAVLARHLGQPVLLPPRRIQTDIDEIDVTLTWSAQPRDLDLHIWVERNDGISEVSFRDRGRLDGPPYAQLDGDVTHGHGRETVKILPAGLRGFKIAVYNWSNESSFSTSDAEVVVSWGQRWRSEFTVPTKGVGRWWTVTEFDHTTASLSIVDTVGDSAKA